MNHKSGTGTAACSAINIAMYPDPIVNAAIQVGNIEQPMAVQPIP